MTTSGSTDFAMGANEIIEEAFDICAIGSEGESISADMYRRANRSLNLITKAWGAEEHLWIRTEGTVTLVAGQQSYAISPKPMRIGEVRRHVTASGYDTPLMEWARQQYFAQSNKATQSIPTAFYYDPQRDTGTLYVWPTASAATASSMTLGMTYLRKLEDFDNTSDTPDLPQEWLLALNYALADQLAVKYVSDPRRRAEISGRAVAYKAAIEAWDTEPASLFLQPERMW